jgi:1-acyl-sn-glycerol-3-phosphate acyltransferase
MVWTTAGRPTRFLAKSTLFKGPFAPLMWMAGALPVYRRSDTGEDPARNAEMFEAVARALSAGEAVCIFPEGTSHSRGRLDPLRTGAARIALASTAAGVHVSIVPVGLNPSRKAVFRSHATIFFGSPFDCRDLSGTFRDDPPQAVGLLTDRISDHLRRVMVEAGPEAELELVERVEALYCTARGIRPTPEQRVARQQLIASGVAALRTRDEARYAQLVRRLRTYEAALARVGLNGADLDSAPPAGAVARFVAREAIYALGLMPIAAAGCLLFAVPYAATDLLARIPSDLEVKATWKLIGGVLLYGLWLAMISLAAGFLFGPVSALVVLVVAPTLGLLALAALERETGTWETIRAYLMRQSAPASLKHWFVRRRSDLADLLEQTHEWLNSAPEVTRGR